MIRRPRRGLPATLTALALLAASVLVATSAIQLLAGGQPVLDYAAFAEALNSTTWNDVVVAVVGALAAVLGLVLLLAVVTPGKATVLPLSDDPADLDSGVSRHSMLRDLRAAANSADGVTSAKVKLRGRKLTAKVRTDRTAANTVADSVGTALRWRLDQISPATKPALRVRITSARDAP